MSDIDRAATVLRPAVFDELAGDALAAAETEIGQAVAEHVHRRAARHRRTGAMDRAIKVTTRGQGEGQTVRVHAGGPVAHLIVGGTRPHRILARARPLPVGPQRFAMSARHPGTRPDPFFAAAVDDSAPDITRALDAAGADLARQLARRMEG